MSQISDLRGASGNFAGSLWMVAAMAGFAVEDAFLKGAARTMPVGWPFPYRRCGRACRRCPRRC